MKLFIPILYTLLLTLTYALCEEISTVTSKELYIKYIKYPNTIYGKQRFAVELEARVLSTKNSFDYVSATYHDGYNIELVSGEISWENIGNNIYTTKILYKVQNKDFKLPIIRLSLELDDQEVNHIEIKAPSINYTQIAINQENFSNIIASDLYIKKIQTKQYNNKMLMIVCNIEAQNSNLEEFYLSKFNDQGMTSFENNYPIQSIFYYLIVPSHIDNISFSYYNPKTLQFINVELPVILEENLVSTQTDLNPNSGNMLRYKQIIVLLLLISCVIIYFITKNKFFILLIIIFLIITIKLMLPNKKIIIAENTKVYILPTKLSTIYQTIDTESEAEILMEKDKFIKIIFKNKNIGWVNKNDIK